MVGSHSSDWTLSHSHLRVIKFIDLSHLYQYPICVSIQGFYILLAFHDQDSYEDSHFRKHTLGTSSLPSDIYCKVFPGEITKVSLSL